MDPRAGARGRSRAEARPASFRMAAAGWESFLIFFFLMFRRPPRSTPFPYPPLFRSVVDRQADAVLEAVVADERRDPAHRADRSEEHTSELQSPCNLVCRLLLEKK